MFDLIEEAMFILGIVGGVASGKSFVAHELEKLGGVILNADEHGHAVLHEAAVIAAIRQHWGEAVIDASGQIVRAEIAKRVFGTGAEFVHEREFLNRLTHPRIRERMQAELASHLAHDVKLVVIDAALLFETGWNALCNGVLFIDTPREQRLARAIERGWTEQQFIAREAAQLPVAEKRQRATWVLDNAHTPEQTSLWLREWFELQEFTSDN